MKTMKSLALGFALSFLAGHTDTFSQEIRNRGLASGLLENIGGNIIYEGAKGLEKSTQEKVSRAMFSYVSFSKDIGGNTIESRGKGFLANGKHFITCEHVVAKKSYEEKNGKLEKVRDVPKFITAKNQETSLHANLLDYNRVDDFAVYELIRDDAEKLNKEKRFLEMSLSDVRKGERVFWFRNDGDKTTECVEGKVTQSNFKNNINNFLVSKPAIFGESGSPIVNYSGKVVGIVKAFDPKYIPGYLISDNLISCKISLVRKAIKEHENSNAKRK